nr:MAG TPA: hypothetical protein [Caudoviricetes sp.]
MIFLPTHIFNSPFYLSFVLIEQLQYNFEMFECQE